MNKANKDDLIDASDATERLLKRLPNLSLEDKVDVCARLRAVAKNCEAIDEIIKADIKKKLRDKKGTVLGDIFKAVLNIVPQKRFDTKSFQQAHADLYDDYCVDAPQARITFEAR